MGAAPVLLSPAGVTADARLSDPAVLDRLSVLVDALQDERRRLANRLAEIEEQLARLSSAVAAREPRLRDVTSGRA